MDSFFSFDLSQGQSGRRFFVAQHLDNPLIADGLEEDIFSVAYSSSLTSSQKHLKRMVEKVIGSSDIDLHACVSPCSNDCEAHHISIMQPYDQILVAETCEELPCHTGSETDIWRIHCTSLVEYYKTLGISWSPSLSISPRASSYYRRSRSLLKAQAALLLQRGRGSREIQVSLLRTAISSHIILSDKYVVFFDQKTRCCKVGSYDMFLSSLDILRVRYRSCLASRSLDLPSTMETRLEQQWKWQAAWIKTLGNEGYEFAKQTEALSKAYMSSATDPELAAGGPYEKMLAKIKKKFNKLGLTSAASISFLDEQLTDYTALMLESTIEEVVELFGVQKAIGHPFIYAERGGQSAAKEALEDIKIEPEKVERLRNTWRSMFLCGYIRKERMWPAMFFSDKAKNTRLHRHYMMDYLGLTPDDIDLDDWNGVVFEKNFDFNYHDNYLDLMDDKAISYYRDEMDCYWDASKESKSSKRLLLELLSRQQVSGKSVVQLVEDDLIPDCWKVVSLFPKEREFKLAARMFAMLVFEMRMFFTISESNLADTIFPYLDRETMTKDKIWIQNMFHKLTKVMSNDQLISLMYECDLSRWNLRWREVVANAVGRDLNMLFGMRRVYTTVHHFFETSVIVVRTPRLRPDGIETTHPPPSSLVWYGHKGGFEGICQKHWTILTYAMIETALHLIGGSRIHFGQGDNQIFRNTHLRDLNVSLFDQICRLRSRAYKILETCCSDVGQELKGEECLESRTVITYSKDVWISGSEYFLSVKSHSRIFPYVSGELPSITTSLGAIWAAGVAAAERNRRPWVSYEISCYLFIQELISILQLDRVEFDTVSGVDKMRLLNTTPLELSRVLWVPNSVGGLPVLLPVDFIYKGGADPLSKAIADMSRASSFSPSVSSFLRVLQTRAWNSKDPSLDTLLQDPYSIPIARFKTVASLTEDTVLTYLRSNTENQDIVELLSTVMEDYKDKLIEELTSIRPFNPVLARDIYDSSCCKTVDTICKMFIETRTIQQASRTQGYDVSSSIHNVSGREFVETMMRLLSVPAKTRRVPLMEGHIVPFVNDLRNAWSTNGVPIYGVSSYVPGAFTVEISPVPTRTQGVKCRVYYSGDPSLSRGPHVPYRGSRTREKRSDYGFKIIGDSGPVAQVKKLSRLATLTGTSPELRDLINRVALSRSPIDIVESKRLGRQIGGTIEHRHHSKREEQGAFTTGLGNFATHCVLDSDHCGVISGSSDDYPIMFQEHFLMAMGIASMSTWFDHPDWSFMEVTICLPCDDLLPLNDPGVTIEGYAYDIPVPDFVHNSLMYDKNASIILLKGPIPHKKLIPEVEEINEGVVNLCSAAIRASILNGISGGGLLDFITDNQNSTTVKWSIDLAELNCLGLTAVLRSVAEAALLESSRCYITSFAREEDKTPFPSYLYNASHAMSLPLMQYLHHPILAKDPLVIELQIGQEYHYMPRMARSSFKLAMKVRAIADNMLRTRQLLRTCTTIFASEAGGCSSRYVMALLGLVMISSISDGDSLQAWRQSLISRHFPGFNDSKGETMKMGLCYDFFKRLIHGRVVTGESREFLLQIMSGSMLRLLQSDHREALRSARLLPSAREVKEIPPPVYYTLTGVMTVISAQDMPRLGMYDDSPDLLRHCVWNSGRILGGTTPSIYDWQLIADWVRKRVVGMVGVGLGGASYICLLSGVKKVVGLDLRSNLEQDTLTPDSIPGLITSCHKYRRFSYSSLVFSSSGDFKDNIVRHLFLSSLPSESILIIDVQPRLSIPEIRTLLGENTGRFSIITKVFLKTHELISYLEVAIKFCDVIDMRLVGDTVGILVIMWWSPRDRVRYSNISQMIVELRGKYPVVERPRVFSFFSKDYTVPEEQLWNELTGGRSSFLDFEGALSSFYSEFSELTSRVEYDTWSVEIAQMCALETHVFFDRSHERIALIAESADVEIGLGRAHKTRVRKTEMIDYMHSRVLFRLPL